MCRCNLKGSERGVPVEQGKISGGISVHSVDLAQVSGVFPVVWTSRVCTLGKTRCARVLPREGHTGFVHAPWFRPILWSVAAENRNIYILATASTTTGTTSATLATGHVLTSVRELSYNKHLKPSQ